MASGAEIYKAELDISNIDRNFYAKRMLTVARHPFETGGRMMLRVLAYCVWEGGPEPLRFVDGLAKGGEPAIAGTGDTGENLLWVEFGTPSVKLVRRAAGRSANVVVVAYGEENIRTWWTSVRADMEKIGKLSVLWLSDTQFETLNTLLERHIRLSVTVQDKVIWVADSRRDVEMEFQTLKAGAVGVP